MGGDQPQAGRHDILSYDADGAGHRANYVRIFAQLTGGTGLVAPLWRSWPRLLGARRLVLTTLETRPKAFLFILLLRSLFGRPSAVVSLRAHLRTGGHLQGRLAMRLLSRLRSVLKLSLVPVGGADGDNQGFVAISDPECWDLGPEDRAAADTPLSAAVREFAGARRILILPGNLNASKGLDFVRDIFCGYPGLFEAVVPVLCGPVDPAGAAAAAELRAGGAFVEARYLERAELMSLYRAAHAAWCCYPPERDLSSGIFGRAVQFGIAPVVRRGSVIDRMAADVPNTMRLDYGDAALAAAQLAANLNRIPPPDSRLAEESAALRRLLAAHFSL